jgi:protein-disulfide isomerase
LENKLSDHNRRAYIKKKQKENRQKSLLRIGIVTFTLLVLIFLIAILPRIIMRSENFKNSNGFEIGDPNAPILVEAFSSYSCPHCKVYSETVEKELIKDYVETGKVFYRYINLPSASDASIMASIASYCAADQNRFFEYKTILYANADQENGFSQENLIKYAESVGLNSDIFSKCMQSDTYREAYLDDRTYAGVNGIKFTPSFLVEGEILTANDLIATIDGLLEN